MLFAMFLEANNQSTLYVDQYVKAANIYEDEAVTNSLLEPAEYYKRIA